MNLNAVLKDISDFTVWDPEGLLSRTWTHTLTVTVPPCLITTTTPVAVNQEYIIDQNNVNPIANTLSFGFGMFTWASICTGLIPTYEVSINGTFLASSLLNSELIWTEAS